MLKYNWFFFFLLLLITLTGCAENQLEVDTEESKIVFLEDLSDHDALTVSVIIKNESTFQSASFQLKIEFLDDKLQNILDMEEVLIGEDQQPPNGREVNGQVYKVKANQNTEGGGTFNIYEDIAESELREIISNKEAVKVILLDEEGNELSSNFINEFREVEEVQES